jgi:hypothetical protein
VPPIAREERGTRIEDSVTTLGRSQHLRVEPNPTVTHASGLTSYLITPPDSPIVVGAYRDPGHESGPSTTRLHNSNSGGSRGKPELPRALPALTPDRPKPLITPPPPALLPMQSKLVVDVPSIDSEVSNMGAHLGHLTGAGKSEILPPPPLLVPPRLVRLRLSRQLLPKGLEWGGGGMLPDSTFPSPPNFTQPVMRSHSASVPRILQNKRSTRTLRDAGDDISKLPDDLRRRMRLLVYWWMHRTKHLSTDPSRSQVVA